jgi:NADH-quinone oxidoreductase subunit J
MTPFQIVFLLVAAATLASAALVVSARRIMHAALWLVLTLLGVAVLFATLEASFFAAVQVIVYIGAIAILIIFAVMLTRRDYQIAGAQTNRTAWLSGLVSLSVAGGLIAALSSWQGFSTSRPELDTTVGAEVDRIAELGRLLVSLDGYAIPFEVASVLLIGALIGAIYLANEQKR